MDEEDLNQDAPPPSLNALEARTRTLVMRRSGGVCEVCGRFTVSDAAHRVGRGVGGTWGASNILGACRACHHRNHSHPLPAYLFGWHLRSGSDPRQVPVLLAVGGLPTWVRLDDQGGRIPLEKDEVNALRAAGDLPTIEDEAEWAQVRMSTTSGR